MATWKSYTATVESDMHVGNLKPVADAVADGGAAGAKSELDMKTSVKLEAVLPDRMRFVGSGGASMGGGIDADARFDGTDAVFTMTMRLPQGTSMQAPPSQTVRASQKELAVPGRPFDVGFNVRGFGLAEGEDLAGTVKWMLTRWTFTEAAPATCDGKACLRIHGKFDLDKSIDDVVSRDPRLGAQIGEMAKQGDEQLTALVKMMAGPLMSMRDLTLDVTPEGDVLAWTLGGENGPILEAHVKDFVLNPAIDPARFAIGDDVKQTAQDVTAQVKQVRAMPPPPPEVLQTFKQRLKDAVGAPAAAPNAPR
jgi:hypothetical protein